MFANGYKGMSLRTKVTAISLAITVLSLTFVAMVSILQIRRQIAAAQRRTADSVALGIARASELSLAVGDRKELARLANGFLRDDNVLFVRIQGANGQTLAKAVRDQRAWELELGLVGGAVGQAEGDAANAGGSCVVGCRTVEATAAQGNEFSAETEVEIDPIGAAGDGSGGPSPQQKPGAKQAPVLGRVTVGISAASMVQSQARQTRMTVLVAVGAGLGGGLVLFLTLAVSMRRLQRLTEASRSISAGDFTGAINDARADEIGRLAQAFDDMRVALRDRDRQLRAFTDTLQEQVRQRTADLEQALAAAEEASRAKSLFLANMSHELRTPLNGVIGMVDLLLAAGPNEQQRRYCDIAKTSARTLLALINDILDFSKIEAGKLELDSIDFDLHETVQAATQMLYEQAERKHIELLCGMAPDVPRFVRGDALRLRQVLVNLMNNAIKFTERGEVVVSVALQSPPASDGGSGPARAELMFKVKDTGVGIPAERVNRLFKSFSQVDSSTTRKFGGTGLGLAISQRIVEMMEGRIGVNSEPGKGSVFWFTVRLPLAAAGSAQATHAGPGHPTGTTAPAPPACHVDLRGMRALAVDDNATNLEIVVAQLAGWQVHADGVADASSALTRLHAAANEGKPYRFAILDMHMPGIDGLSLARMIKSDPGTRDVILISLTSMGHSYPPRDLRAVGIVVCLTKPTMPSQLYDALVEAITRAEALPAPAPAAVGSAAPASAPPSLRGLRILLVEDNEINRMVATELLENVGATVTMAVNGREAVDLALAKPVDVILMDCQMPEMDGFEATRAIRKAEAACAQAVHRPIVALTANAIKGDRERCLEAGMDDYVTKPIDPGELFRAIAAFAPPGGAHAPAGAGTTSPAAVPDGTAVAPPSAPAASAPVDVTALTERCMNNRKLAAKVLVKFSQCVGQNVSELATSVRMRDAAGAAAAAHTLKGSAANVSAEDVRRLAAELEKLAKAGGEGLVQAEARVVELDREVKRLQAFVDTALQQLTPKEPIS